MYLCVMFLLAISPGRYIIGFRGGYEKETRDAEAIVYKVASVQGYITCSVLEFDVHCGGGQRGRHNQITPYAP